MYHNVKHRLLSLLLIVLMVLSILPSAFAGTPDAGNNPPSGGSGNATSAGNKYNGSEQFMRFSVFFAENADWQTGNVIQVGNSVDMYAPGCGPGYGVPVLYGDFESEANTTGSRNTARYYQLVAPNDFQLKIRNTYEHDSSAMRIDPIAVGETWQDWQDNINHKYSSETKTIAFPVLEGNQKNNTDVKVYLKQYLAYNEVLFRTQASKWGWDAAAKKPADPNANWQNVYNLENGTYVDKDGGYKTGQYLIMAETGIYGMANGYPAALTIREAINLNERMNGGYFKHVTTPIKNLANGLYIEKPWLMLGINGTAGANKFTGSLTANVDLIRAKLGVAVVEFPVGKPQGIPAIKYFYDLESGRIDKTLGDKTFFNKADNAVPVPISSTYTAPATENGYKLVGASVSSKIEIRGIIEKIEKEDGGQLLFKNMDTLNNVFSEQAKKKILEGYPSNDALTTYIATIGIIANNDVRNWGAPHSFVTSLGQATKVSEGEIKSIQDLMKFNEDGTLSYNSGKGLNDLQLSLLYVKGEFKPEDIPKVETDNPTQIYKKGNTNVTKMFFDTPEATTPTSKKSEPFGKEAVYTVKDDQPNYKMVEWVIVDDKTPNVPEPYPDWTTVKDNLSEAGKTDKTLGPLGPDNWNNPDRELFIRYEKITEPEVPEVDGELYLPERRISWKKSLSDIGGIPTINFSWPAITGEHLEYDGCGSDRRPCPGHTCTEHVEDGTLTFVSSNTTAVKDSIMGNRTGFMPFDTDNFHSLTRGDSEGTYNMKPNYHFVVWRGQDIPTIASYKYGDTTGNGLAPSAPMIKSLIGEAQAGIAGKATRKTDKNNSYYMDNFTITEGKTLSDTGNMSAFMSFYKGDLANANASLSNLVKSYENAFMAHESAKPAWESAQKSWSNAQSTWSSIQNRYDSWDREYRAGKSDYEAAEKAYKAAKEKYEAIKKDMDDKAIKLTGDKTSIGGHLADYRYSTRWTWGEFGGWFEADGGSTTFNPQVRVDVGFGNPNVGDKKVDFKSSNLNAFGKEYKNVTGFPINNTKTINFWPYVEMIYDTTIGQEGLAVNVLGGHESKLTPQDYVEIGYLPVSANSETTTGLVLQSKQWSTHQSAIKLASGVKNKVLPGGAIYRLTTPGAGTGNSTATTIAVSSWLTFLPSDTINATTAGKDIYNGTAQNNRNEGLYRQVLNSLNSLDVVQIVNGTQVLQELAGTQKVSGTSGQPTSKEPKYWMNQNIKDGTGNANVPASNDAAMKINSVKPNEADLDVTNTKEERIYYRIYSDVKGNVYVSKSKVSAADTAIGKGEVLATAKKTEGADALLKVEEVKALNNRTNLVTNYLASIDRNIGNDKELISKGEDGKWYNEAFDGICVVRINKQIEVGFKDGNMSQAARTAAIDIKLEPVRKSQADLFKSKADSWFETDKHTNLSNEAGYVGTFTNSESGAPATKIIIKDMNGIYKSKMFYIPNASVTDLY